MEDLIYVLLALLWIVFSIIKGRQKQTSKPSAESQPRPKTSWEQMLEELLPPEAEDNEEYIPETPAYETTAPTQQAGTRQYVSPYEAYKTFDFQAEETTPEIISLEESEDTSPLFSVPLMAGDLTQSQGYHYDPKLLVELRRAIVYNAILERPAW